MANGNSTTVDRDSRVHPVKLYNSGKQRKPNAKSEEHQVIQVPPKYGLILWCLSYSHPESGIVVQCK